MRICIIGKMPPIQGGVSKLNFWIAQALALAGHEVHVLTNAAEVEKSYRSVNGKLVSGRTSPLDGLENIRVHYTDERRRHAYIPYANPFVTKLSSMAIDIVREHRCDLIFGHYFEPYGMAAYLASKVTGVPFGLLHAGSDVGRLMQSPEMRTVYSEMMRSADFVFSSRTSTRRFLQEGVDAERLYQLPPAATHDGYTPDAPPLDMAAHLERARVEFRNSPAHAGLLDRFPLSSYNPARPTIGVYGKTAESKGSYDLVEALTKLKARGLDFNFLALTNSATDGPTEFMLRAEAAGLADRMTWLPFVPYWEVPSFIRLCTAVCFLERDFSIPIHQPAVAVEIMYCGGCLIVSHEIADKQRFKGLIEDGVNALLVDPKDTDALADRIALALSDPERARSIGRAARAMLLTHSQGKPPMHLALGERFETILNDVTSRRQEAQMVEFQSFLNRLYTDDVFRKLHSISSEASQSFFRLSDSEKEAIKGLELRAVQEFAEGLRVKALQRHKGFLPLSAKALGAPVTARFFERYYAICRPYPGETKLALIGKFGQFLEDSALAELPQSSWVPELIRFERTLMEVGLRTGPEDDFSHINKRMPVVAEIVDDDVVYVRSSVVLDRFTHDTPMLAETLRTGEVGAVEPKETNVVFVAVPNEAQPKVLKVNAASIQLLRLAGTGAKLSELVSRFGDYLGRPVTTKDVRDALMFFSKGGVVGVRAAEVLEAASA